ncbi:MAG TPA: hypothetical protein VF292_02760 [Rhodanobacteraceae bacterium]
MNLHESIDGDTHAPICHRRARWITSRLFPSVRVDLRTLAVVVLLVTLVASFLALRSITVTYTRQLAQRRFANASAVATLVGGLAGAALRGDVVPCIRYAHVPWSGINPIVDVSRASRSLAAGCALRAALYGHGDRAAAAAIYLILGLQLAPRPIRPRGVRLRAPTGRRPRAAHGVTVPQNVELASLLAEQR